MRAFDLPPSVARFTESAKAQIEEADEEADGIEMAADDPTALHVRVRVAEVRSLLAAHCIEDLVGAIAALHEHHARERLRS